MQIEKKKRPWEKSNGTRANPDPFYQSRQWKMTRVAHDQGHTIVMGKRLSNRYCVECFKETGNQVLGRNKDHIVRIKDGGSRTDLTNLQSLCDSHHGTKSAIEGNNARKKK